MFLRTPDNLPSYVALSLTRDPDHDFSSWVLVIKHWENYALVEDREVRYALSVSARQELVQRSPPGTAYRTWLVRRLQTRPGKA